MRLRSVSETVNEIKANDPGTRLTVYLLRKMIKRGIVPVTMVTNRQYIDLDSLPDFLTGKRLEYTPSVPQTSTGIRPIKE